MGKKKKNGGITNIFEEGANCQVFNGDISGCVFAMPGASVTQQNRQEPIPLMQESNTDSYRLCHEEAEPQDTELCHLIHPSVDSSQEWQVHDEIKRLVERQGIQEICRHLTQMKDEKKVLLPQVAERAYNELVRMGMPNGEGYSLKTFMKHYKR